MVSGNGAGGLTMTSCTVSHNTAGVRSPSPPPGSLMLALCVFAIVFLLAPILLPVMREVSLACSQYGGGVFSNGAGVLTMTSCTVSHNTAAGVRSPSPPRGHVPHAVCLSSLFTPPPLPLCLRAPRESLSLSLSNTHPHVIPGAVWCGVCNVVHACVA